MFNSLIRAGFLVCITGLLSASMSAHDFHASVTQMQYDPKERTFEISIRIFTDDFEKALAEATKSKVNLNGPGKNDQLIEKYVQAHFSYANAQKQAKPIKYIGYEVETDAHWIYLEMPYNEPFKGGSLKQNVLMEMFDDQVNMVNVQYQGHKKTFVFRKNQSIQDIWVD
ncbi:DUF6702 family protein [Spirosoma pollinicola]|nr:DUF6702 family protein [Spirosoma pollinicola]